MDPPSPLPTSRDWAADLKTLLAAPTIASKRWISEQYDHMVQVNTALLPGADAALLRLKGSRKALAMTLDCNALYTRLDPRTGAAIARDVYPDLDAFWDDVARAYGLQPGFTYEHALRGMSALVPPGRLEALQRDPRVAYVVEDMVRSINVQAMPTGIQRIFAGTNPEIAINGESAGLH